MLFYTQSIEKGFSVLWLRNGYGKEIQYSTRAYTTEHTEPLVSLEQKDEDRLREQMRVTTNLRVYSFRLRGRAKL